MRPTGRSQVEPGQIRWGCCRPGTEMGSSLEQSRSEGEGSTLSHLPTFPEPDLNPGLLSPKALTSSIHGCLLPSHPSLPYLCQSPHLFAQVPTWKSLEKGSAQRALPSRVIFTWCPDIFKKIGKAHGVACLLRSH